MITDTIEKTKLNSLENLEIKAEEIQIKKVRLIAGRPGSKRKKVRKT